MNMMDDVEVVHVRRGRGSFLTPDYDFDRTTTGPGLPKAAVRTRACLRKFDGNNRYNVVLIAEDKKFYVLKEYLAEHSHFFQGMFFGGMREANKDEVNLPEVLAAEIQPFLEAIYGEHFAVDDETVEGVMKLADMWQAQTPMIKCREWIKNSSKLSKKDKFRLCAIYNQGDMKRAMLQELDHHEDVQDLMPANREQLDPETIWELLRYSTSLPNRPRCLSRPLTTFIGTGSSYINRPSSPIMLHDLSPPPRSPPRRRRRLVSPPLRLPVQHPL